MLVGGYAGLYWHTLVALLCVAWVYEAPQRGHREQLQQTLVRGLILTLITGLVFSWAAAPYREYFIQQNTSTQVDSE